LFEGVEIGEWKIPGGEVVQFSGRVL